MDRWTFSVSNEGLDPANTVNKSLKNLIGNPTKLEGKKGVALIQKKLLVGQKACGWYGVTSAV